MIKIILVRHGETFGNRNNIIQGHGPGHLTPKGFVQAKKLALHLKDMKIDKIYVSDLQRTVQTAAEIIKYHQHAKVVYDKRIRERNYGIFEGKNIRLYLRAMDKSRKPPINFRPVNGETVVDIYKRAKSFLDNIIKNNDGKTILIVSHGGFVRNSIIHLLNDTLDNYRKYVHKNTGMTIIEISKGKVKLKKLNSVKHLE